MHVGFTGLIPSVPTIEGLNRFTAPLNEKISVLEKRAREAAANFVEAAMNLGDRNNHIRLLEAKLHEAMSCINFQEKVCLRGY